MKTSLSGKKSNVIIYIIDAILIILAVINNGTMLNKPDLPRETNYSSSEYLLNNEEVLEINGIQINYKNSAEIVVDKFNIYDTLRVKSKYYDKESNHIIIRERDLELVRFYFLDYFIISAFVGLIYVVLGIFMLRNAKDRTLSLVFHWLLISSAVMLLNTWGGLRDVPQIISLILRTLNDYAYFIVPIIFMHFSFITPKLKWERHKVIFNSIYYISPIVFILLALVNYNYIYFDNAEYYQIYEIVHFGFLKPFMIPCFLFVIANFIHSYINSKMLSDRRRILWIFTGLFLGPTVYIFLYRLPEQLINKVMISETYMVLALASSPIALFISIYKYKFLDIQFILKRSFVYFLIFLFLGAVYIFTLWLLRKIVLLNLYDIIYAADAIATLLVLFLFQPVKKRIQLFVDKKLFQVYYDYRQVEQEFLESIKYSMNVNEIKNSIFNILNKYIHTNDSKILTFINSEFNLSSQINGTIAFHGSLLSSVISKIKSNSKMIISKENVIEDYNEFEEDKQFIKYFGSELIAFSKSDDNHIAVFIACDKKRTNMTFNPEDVALLKLMCNETINMINKIELEKALIIQKEETKKLEELNSLKSLFVSSVSHELKTPLTSIKLFAEILAQKNENQLPKNQEFLTIIQGECERLNRLIDNILDYSKIEKGTKEYRFKPININSTIIEVLKSMEYVFKLNRFSLNTNIDSNEFMIFADEDAIKEVLINILSNSIKYSLNLREIDIDSSIYENKVVVAISDKGIGINPEEQAKIFEPFYRSKDKNASIAGGAGIGLSIVKSIIDAHQAQVELISEPMKGTCIKLFFDIWSNDEEVIDY